MAEVIELSDLRRFKYMDEKFDKKLDAVILWMWYRQKREPKKLWRLPRTPGPKRYA